MLKRKHAVSYDIAAVAGSDWRMLASQLLDNRSDPMAWSEDLPWVNGALGAVRANRSRSEGGDHGRRASGKLANSFPIRSLDAFLGQSDQYSHRPGITILPVGST
jgi:hypothetical protein